MIFGNSEAKVFNPDSNHQPSNQLVPVNNELHTNSSVYNDNESFPSKTWIYISENVANKVIRCELRPNSVQNCAIVLDNLLGAEHMAIANNKFFIVNYNEPIMRYCDLDADGYLSSSLDMRLPINNPGHIEYVDHRLFISDLAFKKMVQCNLNDSFLPQNCSVIVPNIPHSFFNTAHYQNYKYSIVYDSVGAMMMIDKCAESACNKLYDVNLSDPVTIGVLNNTAYILDYSNNILVGCKLHTNGDFKVCSVLKSGLNSPLGLTFYTSRQHTIL